MKLKKIIIVNKTVLVLLLIMLGLITALFINLIYIPNREIYDILNSLFIGLVSLFSSIIALSLPFIMKNINKREIREKSLNKRKKGYKAFEDLCNFYFQHFDTNRGVPKESIEVIERTKMISQVETLYTYRKELFPIGIIISSGWNEIEGNHNIYIHSTEEIDIRILAHDFGKIKKIELKYQGVIVRNNEEIQNSLENIKSNINTVEK